MPTADRNIVQTNGATNKSYQDRLFSLIPAEMTGGYLAISNMIDPNTSNAAYYLLVVLLVLTLLLPFYLRRIQDVTNVRQIIVTTVSLPIWALNISSLVIAQFCYQTFGLSVPTFFFGIVLILWTIAAPIIVQ